MRGSFFANRAGPTARATIGVAALVCCVTARASAAPSDAPTVELSWTGPGPEATCIGGEALIRAVNEYLGRHAISSPPAELLLSVFVERQSSGWRALIKLQDQRAGEPLGERELHSPGPLCSGLDEPLKLAVALLVDSELAEIPNHASDPERPPPVAAVEPESESEGDSESAGELLAESEPWRFDLDASVLLESGLLPSRALGMDLGFEASPIDWLVLRAHGVALAPQTLHPAGDATVRAAVLHGGIALCPRTELLPNWKILGCFGVDLGRLWVTPSGFTATHAAARRLLMPWAGPKIVLDLSRRLSLFSHFFAIFPSRQDRFLIDVDGKSRESFTVSVVAWSLGLGASLSF